jgi:hypothetical protein
MAESHVALNSRNAADCQLRTDVDSDGVHTLRVDEDDANRVLTNVLLSDVLEQLRINNHYLMTIVGEENKIQSQECEVT